MQATEPITADEVGASRIAIPAPRRRIVVNRRWALAALMFAVAMAAFGATAAYLDRQTVLLGAEERTRSVARMIAAHAEASIAQARSVLEMIDSRTAGWDFDDADAGGRLFEEIRDALDPFPTLSSAWIVDAAGRSRFDTWSFPPRVGDAAARPYFKAHEASDDTEILVLGDERPGTITGQERFTVSRARRNEDGSLHSITVVAVYTRALDALYAEAATWPGARGGLYNLSGDILARIRTQQRASPEFIAAMDRNVQRDPSGTAVISDYGEPRVVSWQRLGNTPTLYTTSSQTVSSALAEWRQRTAGLAAICLATVVLFGLFAWSSARAARAEEAARYHELAIREIHHRVKNALSLLVAMVRIQSRRHDAAGVRAELSDVASRLQTIADTEDLLENARALDEVNIADLLARLVERSGGDGRTVRLTAEGAGPLDTSVATTVAIAANELITNALKHGGRRLDVAWRQDGDGATLSLTSDGTPLPEDFDVAASTGFGLRMIADMARRDGGRLSAENTPAGTVFTVRWPASALA